MRARQRPGASRAAADGMKLHRWSLRLDGRDHTVVGLRPGTTARFSTNRYHGTWHVLSDQHGARLLARLLWGLSYQARRGTLLVIDRPFLTTNPFDADPADPIVIVPNWHTSLGERAARALKRRLPLGPPDGTVRWRTYGLDRASADPAAWFDTLPAGHWRRQDGKVARRAGVVAIEPSDALEMRAWALGAASLEATRPYGDHQYLGGSCNYASGEVQVFHDFRRRVSLARVDREWVRGRRGAPADPGELREAVWQRSYDRGRAESLCGRPELGWETVRWLNGLGISTVAELAAAGVVPVFRRLRAAERPGLSPLVLLALEAVATGGSVPEARKKALLAELARR